MNEKLSPIKIAVQLFVLGILMSLILSLIKIPALGTIVWITIPPTIVSKYYIKKYKVVMPTNLRKYSAIYYMSLSCLIGFIAAIFTLYADKKIDDLSLLAGFLMFFIIYFIVGTLLVYFCLGIDESKKN
ncbi:MAG: hypothetical protein QM487_00625 [Candidatus Marithrix sp.]